jgi:hypothetical protein
MIPPKDGLAPQSNSMNENEHAIPWKPKNNSICHICWFDMLPLFLHFKELLVTNY